MKTNRYAAYYRVSTKRQGESGLGLEAQQRTVKLALSGKGELAKEFIEVESGKKTKRPQLEAAINFCKRNGCILVVSQLDRLGRKASHLQEIKEHLEILVCNMPEMDKFMFGLFALLAEKERDQISERTKAALKSKKERGANLGSPENLTDATRALGRETKHKKAQEKAVNLRAFAIAKDLKKQGLSLQGIAKKLNDYGLCGAKGGRYHAVTVSKLFRLYQ
jgi:DNA invertase Pin-like site-specific DNA recombinase